MSDLIVKVVKSDPIFDQHIINRRRNESDPQFISEKTKNRSFKEEFIWSGIASHVIAVNFKPFLNLNSIRGQLFWFETKVLKV